jgi:hypothetical protein
MTKPPTRQPERILLGKEINLRCLRRRGPPPDSGRFSHFNNWRAACFRKFMFTAVTLLAAGTFIALVIRRLKYDIEQENELSLEADQHPAQSSPAKLALV